MSLDPDRISSTKLTQPARRRRLRDEYLRWLYRQIEELDRNPTPDEFLATAPAFDRVPYTAADVEKAGEWLQAGGYIGGPSVDQYRAPLRPTLTQKGIHAVENGKSVNEESPEHFSGMWSPEHTSEMWLSSGYVTVVNGPANVNNGGNNVHQSLNVEWAAQARQLVDTIDQALPALDPAVAKDVRAQIALAREELAGEAELGRLRTILDTLVGFLSQTLAGGLGGVLAAQALTLLANLPT
jgi:hypothetical protein